VKFTQLKKKKGNEGNVEIKSGEVE